MATPESIPQTDRHARGFTDGSARDAKPGRRDLPASPGLVTAAREMDRDPGTWDVIGCDGS